MFLLFWSRNSVSLWEERTSSAERSRKTQSSESRQIRERSRRVEATPLCLCVYINSGQSFHRHLWAFVKSALVTPPHWHHHHCLFLRWTCWYPVKVVNQWSMEGIISLAGWFLMRCSTQALPRPVSTAAARAAASETSFSERWRLKTGSHPRPTKDKVTEAIIGVYWRRFYHIPPGYWCKCICY